MRRVNHTVAREEGPVVPGRAYPRTARGLAGHRRRWRDGAIHHPSDHLMPEVLVLSHATTPVARAPPAPAESRAPDGAAAVPRGAARFDCGL